MRKWNRGIVLAVGLALLGAGMANVSAAAAAAGPGPETKAKIQQLKDFGGTCYIQWSMFTPQMKARFTELKPDAELEKMFDIMKHAALELAKLDKYRYAQTTPEAL